MVVSNLKGGLGNYLFQIAAGYALAYKNNDIFKIDRDKILQVHSNWRLYENNIFRGVEINDGSVKYTPYKYESLTYKELPYYNDILLDGYFQSEKYMLGCEDKIKTLFDVDNNTLNYIKNKYNFIISDDNTCSIHIRRGDFLKIDFYNKLNMMYYRGAIEEIGKDKHFIIFSNEIEWCKSNFSDIDATFISNEHDYIDLYLMSMCKDNITANSTFSWWGAYLNKNANKKIITPKNWFTHTHSNEDLTPESWIKIN